MDLFGNKRKQLRQELSKVSNRAAERQDKIAELERVIDDLKAEVHSRRRSGASSSEVSAAEAALRDAQAIHSDSTR
jgi:flagellar biosynthesis chaperone FliJ